MNPTLTAYSPKTMFGLNRQPSVPFGGYQLPAARLEQLRQSLTPQDLQRIHDERTDTLFDTDSYKTSHYLQYPPGTQYLSAYLESRGGYAHSTLFFGLEYLIERFLTQKITPEMVEEAAETMKDHGVPFNKDGWMKIATELGGNIPLEIKAVSEGSVVPTGNVLMQYTNTKPGYEWVVGWFETQLMRLWYPTSVATKSFEAKKHIRRYLDETSDNTDASLRFMLHDFGSRGASSRETAGVGGMAHLLNFVGTDTIMGIRYAQRYYNAGKPGIDFAISIPAAEHSTITSWGEAGEIDAFRNMLKQFAKPGAVLAVVSDSWHYYRALGIWGQLADEVKKSGARLVVRPDSGKDKVQVIVDSLIELDKHYGSVMSSKGYKVLNNVRVIQGDGIDLPDLVQILEAVKKAGYSVENLAFGMGAGLLQKTDRDTHKFAIKTNAINKNGVWEDVYKDPKGKDGKSLDKTSKRGQLDLILDLDGNYKTIRLDEKPNSFPNRPSQLVTFYKDGQSLVNENFDTIKARANGAFQKLFQKPSKPTP